MEAIAGSSSSLNALHKLLEMGIMPNRNGPWFKAAELSNRAGSTGWCITFAWEPLSRAAGIASEGGVPWPHLCHLSDLRKSSVDPWGVQWRLKAGFHCATARGPCWPFFISSASPCPLASYRHSTLPCGLKSLWFPLQVCQGLASTQVPKAS